MLNIADFREYLHSGLSRTFDEYASMSLREQEAVRDDFMLACEQELEMSFAEYSRRIRPATLNSYAATLLASRKA